MPTDLVEAEAPCLPFGIPARSAQVGQVVVPVADGYLVQVGLPLLPGRADDSVEGQSHRAVTAREAGDDLLNARGIPRAGHRGRLGGATCTVWKRVGGRLGSDGAGRLDD